MATRQVSVNNSLRNAFETEVGLKQGEPGERLYTNLGVSFTKDGDEVDQIKR